MVRNSAFVTLLSIGGSILGFFVQILLAQYFGVDVEVEAYFFSLSAPTFIAGMASAMLSYTIIPRLVECEKDINYHRQYIVSLLFGIAAISFVLIFILFNTLGKWQVYSLPTDSLIRQYDDLPLLMFISYLVGAFQILQGCFIAILNSIRYYTFASAIGLLPYFIILILLLTLGKSADILVVPISMLFGIVVCILTEVYILRSRIFPLPYISNLLWAELGKLLWNAPFTAVAMSCFSSYVVIDAYWAPQAGAGTLAALSYVQRLIIGVGNLAVAGPSVVLVPNMAEFVRNSDYKRFKLFLIRALMVVGSIASSLSLFLFTFSDKLVSILFARGKFDQEAIITVSATLRHMAPGMITMLMSVIAFRALFCFRGAEPVTAVLGLLWTTFYFLTSYILHKDGAVGIATGYSLVWTIFFIILTTVIFSGYIESQFSSKRAFKKSDRQ
jgi:putative peptidoglycan lipid II flippase